MEGSIVAEVIFSFEQILIGPCVAAGVVGQLF